MASELDSLDSASLKRLIKNIGRVESIKLLTEALPIITARKHDLLTALRQKDFDGAHQLAHKTTGSVRLYGSNDLEALLQEVMSLSEITTPRSDLCDELEREFDHSIDEIEKCINANPIYVRSESD